MDSRPNSVSPLPEVAPLAELDPTPPEMETTPGPDEPLPPPPPQLATITISEKQPEKFVANFKKNLYRNIRGLFNNTFFKFIICNRNCPRNYKKRYKISLLLTTVSTKILRRKIQKLLRMKCL